MGRGALKPAVFLSASTPDPRRDPRYFKGTDLTAIREAVRALALTVLPRARLVFGGHPAITPLVRMVAESLGATRRVRIFQSTFFAGNMPGDNDAFPDLVLVQAVPDDRSASLLRMREEMIRSQKFGAAVFIGGMEGVEAEHELFARLRPGARVLPVASTGGAARGLFKQGVGPREPEKREALEHDTVYGALFLRLLGYE